MVSIGGTLALILMVGMLRLKLKKSWDGSAAASVYNHQQRRKQGRWRRCRDEIRDSDAYEWDKQHCLCLNPNNSGVIGNALVIGPSRCSSGYRFLGSTTTSKYMFFIGSPYEWADREQCILKEGLTRQSPRPP